MMELKKNPKKDLNKSSGLFFATGMALVLAMTYFAFEWKTFYSNTDYDTSMNVEDELIEENPIFTLETPPPPPPPPADPIIIEVVPDDPEIEETVIATTETNQEEVIKYEDIEVATVIEELDIPFAVIENVPVFPGCENESDKRSCFNKMILKHVKKTFRYPTIPLEMGVQGKVYMHFVIQKDGSIGNIQIARSPDKNLGIEATRIISKLPKMTPGKQRGIAVRVPFSLPITFKLSN